MSNSPNLSLPYIQPSQAQKHITHNLAIERLDALVHLSVTELYAAGPPETPFEGQVVGVASGAAGVFAGQDGHLAYRTNGAWMFVPPRNGFKAWVESRGSFYVYHEGDWRVLLSVGIDELEGLGLNTGWDQVNRLAVAAKATLLSHEGAGHQLKINKAAPADTASLLFQSGFSGRAEIGLAGSDALSLKVSADGTAWSTALAVDGATGDATMGRVRATEIAGDAVQATPGDTTPGRLMRADWGYGRGNVLGPVAMEGSLAAGALFERGSAENASYVKTADGRVEVIMAVLVDTTSTGVQQFALPVALTNTIHPVSCSNVGSNPNAAIRASNIRMIRVAGSNIQLRLETTSSVSGDPNNDTLLCRVNGYWY